MEGDKKEVAQATPEQPGKKKIVFRELIFNELNLVAGGDDASCGDGGCDGGCSGGCDNGGGTGGCLACAADAGCSQSGPQACGDGGCGGGVTGDSGGCQSSSL
jgi:hypothetical protein